MPGSEIVKRRLWLLDQREFSPDPPAGRPSTVNARATSSNDAGTVMTTSCAAKGASGCAIPRRRHMGRAAWPTLPPAKSWLTSAGAPHGRMGAERSTPAWQSQLLADATSRPGTRAPCQRANSPAIHARRFSPRQLGRAGRQFVFARECKGRKATTAAPPLRPAAAIAESKSPDTAASAPGDAIGEGHGTIGRAEINANDIGRGYRITTS